MSNLLISCEIFRREIEAFLCASAAPVSVDYVPQSWHDSPGPELRLHLQSRIDQVPPDRYAAILLGYGLCNQVLHGLQARHTRLVIPRAHDCLDLFLGSRIRHRQLCAQCPGQLFRTAGWMAMRPEPTSRPPGSSSARQGFGKTLEDWRQHYDEDTALYLYQTLSQPPARYDQLTYIETGVSADDESRPAARREADQLGLRFTVVPGEGSWLQRLLHGPWPADDFLEVPPGSTILPAYDVDEVIKLKPGHLATAAVEARLCE